MFSTNISVETTVNLPLLSIIAASSPTDFMVDLFTEFKAEAHLFDAMMYIAIAGLGFTASEKFASSNKEK